MANSLANTGGKAYMVKFPVFLICTSFLANAAYATVIEFNSKGEAEIHGAVDYLSAKRHSARLAGSTSRPVKWPERRAQYEPLVKEAAIKNGLPETLLHAVILAESNYDASAESSAGAVGLMQLMPDTAVRFGVTDRKDAGQNIAGGAAYLKWLLDRYKGDHIKALAAYNAGEGKVDLYGGIPPYKETQSYVARISHILNNNLINF